jgi:hypothetical protein
VDQAELDAYEDSGSPVERSLDARSDVGHAHALTRELSYGWLGRASLLVTVHA